MKHLAALALLLLALALPASAQDSTTTTNPQPNLIAPEIYARAGAALDAQDYETALRDYSLFIYLNPTYSIAYYERAYGYIGLNDIDAALNDVSHAIRLSAGVMTPEFNAALYALRGDIETQQQQYEAAVADYTSALNLAATASTYFSRGIVYAEQNDYAAALDDLSAAIELDATNPGYYLLRGQVSAKNGDTQAAGTDYMRFFSVIQPQPTENNVLQSGSGVILPMARAVVHQIPFRAKAGQYVSARADGDAQTIDPLLVLVAPDGTVLAGDDDAGGGLSSLIVNVQVETDGEYMLVLGHAAGGFTGNVQVRLLVSDDPLQ